MDGQQHNFVSNNVTEPQVLWVVSGSHARLNSAAESAQIVADPQVPLPGSVPTRLEAGDGVAYSYILPILHWGSDYSTTRLVRCAPGWT